jgi:hypothetical protein
MIQAHRQRLFDVTPIQVSISKTLRDQDRTVEMIQRGYKNSKGFWVPGPLAWLWHCTETFDPHYLDKGLSSPHRAFPRLPYMQWLFTEMLTEPVIFFPKSREMMLSWAVIGYCTWMCQIFPGTQVLVQSQKLDKSSELVKGTEPPGYAYTLYSRQEQWLKDRFPLAMRPADLPADNLVWKNGSEIKALGKGADQIRLYHPTIVMMDEAGFMDEAEASFGAATPVAKQILVVSSASPGWFGTICSEESG